MLACDFFSVSLFLCGLRGDAEADLGAWDVACQRDGTGELPRGRDHLAVWSSMVVSVLLVNCERAASRVPSSDTERAADLFQLCLSRVVSISVSFAFVRGRPPATTRLFQRRSRTVPIGGGHCTGVLKIGRSAVRPRPWPRP
jgi:hypothetical protein